MADCECLAGCPFYNDKMDQNAGVGKIFKTKYCLGDNSNCARFVVFKKLGKGSVPGNLYPNMMDRAREILAGK